jgi:type IV pilus assembly protein PilM
MFLSIDVANDNLYAVEGSSSAGTVSIFKAGQSKLALNTVEDGVIKNHASFIMTLNRVISAKSLTARLTIFTFNSSSVMSRHLDLPLSKPKEIDKMVKNEMLQIVTDPGEFVYEYSVVNSAAAIKSNIVSVWAYALPKEIIDEYHSYSRATKLKPMALEVHSNSIEKLLLNASVNGKPFSSQSMLFAQIEEDGLEIHLFSDGQRAFSRTSPVSATELKILLGNSGISTGKGSFFDSVDLTSEKVKNDSILSEVANQYINYIADELYKMIQFQQRRDAKNPVSAVYIYGGMAVVKGLAQEISEVLDINTETIEALSTVKNPNNIRLTKYINAIGALIRL